MYFGHGQIDGRVIVIALCVIRCHSNNTNSVCSCFSKIGCRDSVRSTSYGGTIDTNIGLAIPHINIVFECYTSRIGGFVPRDLEAIAYFDLLIVCCCNGRSRNNTERIDGYGGRHIRSACFYLVAILVESVNYDVSCSRLIKSMASRICYGRSTGLTPTDHIEFVTICIKHYSILRICITLNSKGCNRSVYGLVDRRKLRIFLNFGYGQIDGCIIVIALCVIGCHSNYTNGIRSRFVDFTCGNRIGSCSKVLRNKRIGGTIIQIHVILERHSRRCSRLTPRNFETIPNFDLLVVGSSDRRCPALSERNNVYGSCYFAFRNLVTILIESINFDASRSSLIKGMTTRIGYGRCAGLAPVNHIQLVAIGIQNNPIFRVSITFDSKRRNRSTYTSAYGRKIWIFLYFGHGQVDRCIVVIALRVICCLGNYTYDIRSIFT